MEVVVLFQDVSGIFYPLSHLFFSSSNQLIGRNSTNVSEEVLSSFCPQCFTRFFDADETQRNAKYRHCTSCLMCPYCDGILSKQSLSPGAGLLCGNCLWLCNPPEDSSVDQDAYFANLLKYHMSKHKLDSPASFNSLQSSEAVLTKPVRHWQLSDLEVKLNSHEIEQATHSLDDFYALQLHTDVGMSIKATHTVPLVPQHVRLVNKRSVRSQADKQNNRMNILLLPKTLPLEGDSSQLVHRGKWSEKNAAATLALPTVTILRLPKGDETDRFIVLKMINHADEGVILRFKAQYALASPRRYILQSHVDNIFRVTEALPIIQIVSDDKSLVLKLEAYEDDLLKEELAVEPFHLHPPLPLDDTTHAWRHVLHSNVLYLYLPVALDSLELLQHAWELDWTYELGYKDFKLTVQSKIRVLQE